MQINDLPAAAHKQINEVQQDGKVELVEKYVQNLTEYHTPGLCTDVFQRHVYYIKNSLLSLGHLIF